MEPIELQRLQNLRDEYSKLYSLFEKHWLMPYQIIPIFVTIGGALSIYSKGEPMIWGLGVSYGVVLLLAWLAFNHVCLLETGLKLVELECRLNIQTCAEPNARISWQAEITAIGFDQILGLQQAVILLACLIVPIFITAEIFAWRGLAQRYPDEHWACLSATLLPAVLVIAILMSMMRTEDFAHDKKLRILDKYYPQAPTPPSTQ